MKVKDLTLEQWQDFVCDFKYDNKKPHLPCAMRCDGTQFSVGAMYGGFTYNGETYTCFYFPKQNNAVIGVRMDFLKLVTKKLKEVGSK